MSKQTQSLVVLMVALLCCTSVGFAGSSQLTQLLAPRANWLNPVEGSYLEITVSASAMVEDSVSSLFLIGLPFSQTSFSVAVASATSSCGLEDAEWSTGWSWAADVADVRSTRDGLTYYWISTSLPYVPDNFITIRLYLDLPTAAGFTTPLDLALVSSTTADYMIFAQNPSLVPILILDAPSESLELEAETFTTVLGTSYNADLKITTSLQSRRFVLSLSGFDLDADFAVTLSRLTTIDEVIALEQKMMIMNTR